MTVAGSSLATSRPAEDDVERVGQPDQLLEVGRDQQHREPLGAGVADAVPDGGLRARRRRRGWGARRSSTLGPPLSSRPMMSFCWLPPDSAHGERVRSGGADVVLAHDPLGVVPGDRRRSQEPPAERPRATLVPQHAVLPEGCAQQQACRCRSSGMKRDPALPATLGGPGGDVLAVQGDRAGGGVDQADAASRPARSGRCPRRRRSRPPRRAWMLEADVVEHRRRPRTRLRRPRGRRAATCSVTVDSRVSGTGSSLPTIISASCRAVTDWGRPCRPSCRAGSR